MNPTQASDQIDKPIRLAGATLGEYRHICAFFNSADEQYRVLLPFIKEGFERGDKAYHLVNPNLREEHVRRLEAANIELPELKKDGPRKDGQFELYDWAETYLQGGRFDQDRMLALLEELFADSPAPPFRVTRLCPTWTGRWKIFPA